MRIFTMVPWSAVVGAMVLVLPAGLLAAQDLAAGHPMPAGDAPSFLFAAVQPITAPPAWRAIYHQVERGAGPTYAFNIGSRIVLVRQDTTYLRHEMLHHILQVAGWEPRPLRPGEHYSIADLHPTPVFDLCAGRTDNLS